MYLCILAIEFALQNTKIKQNFGIGQQMNENVSDFHMFFVGCWRIVVGELLENCTCWSTWRRAHVGELTITLFHRSSANNF